MVKVLLVEDDESLGATLKERLGKEGYAVVWCNSFSGAASEISLNLFDLYIFDLGLPDGTGYDLVKKISNAKPFIFLTAQGDAQSRLKGYELGAHEYIPKPFHLRELLIRVRHVLENHSKSNRLQFLDVVIDYDKLEITRSGKVQQIITKDILLLKSMIELSPKVLSRDEALNIVWGEDKFPSNRSVDNSILRVRNALGEQVSACVESVRGIGYRWNAENLKGKQ